MRKLSVCGLFAALMVVGCSPDNSANSITAQLEGATAGPAMATSSSGVSIQPPASTVLLIGNSLTLRSARAFSGRRQLKAISWESATPAVAIVSPTSGVVHAVAAGRALVRVSPGISAAATDSIFLDVVSAQPFVISPASATVQPGTVQQLSTTSPSAVWWSSANASVASVSTSGLLTAVGVGSTSLTATNLAGVSASISVLVAAPPQAPVPTPPATLISLEINPPSVTLNAGDSRQFTVSGVWSDGATNTPTATYFATGGSITSSGLYTAGVIPGVYRVIATHPGSTKADTSTVNIAVPVATLVQLVLSPATLSITAGATQQFTVAATWSNGSTTLPALAYSATGGTVNASGLYTAGTTAGSYRVIASGGGRADTSVVTVSAPNVRTLLDMEFYSRGQYGAYASPWSKFLDNSLRHDIDYSDSIVVDVNAFPASTTTIKWNWPSRIPTSSGVWGYMFMFYGNYDGGEPFVRVTPRQVKNIETLRQDFSITHNSSGSYNVLNEFYLTSEAGNPNAKVIEIGYFLHSAAENRPFFEQGLLIGTYRDATGVTWVARMNGTFCMLMTAGYNDVVSGSIDVGATLAFLKTKGIITGNEWFNGIALGVEPVRGSGELSITRWTVSYN